MTEEKKEKVYILDTSSIIENFNKILEELRDCRILIPFQVLEELDKNKDKHEVRTTIRKIFSIISEKSQKLEFIKLKKKSKDLDLEIKDNIIIQTILDFKNSNKKLEIVVISNDLNMCIKLESLNIRTLQMFEEFEEIYNGKEVLEVTDYEIDLFYSEKFLENDCKFIENQCIILKSPTKSALGVFKNGKVEIVKNYNKKSFKNGKIELSTGSNLDASWIYPRNKEQQFSMNFLMDKEIKILSLMGIAGVGKTLLAISSGLYQTLVEEEYDRVIITRPIQPLGNDLGYLPGNLKEKMTPWISPIYDNLENILKHRMSVEDLILEGIIEIEAPTYMRGRSISRSFIICDESQNLTKHEIKTICTRVGEGSKIIFTGDVEQIDSPKLNKKNNGLSYLVSKLKNQNLFAHITLEKSERSKIAEMCAKLL